ncbi:hypothetical protein [Flavisolibacter ginsengisoli]|jgi:hypothetical protein|uniref:Uncharacterized protein n=1 Tax=Flavisolibacter ginsengisoli DSM 18119 TaxID=1121884 RepID=A0A1M5CWW0_9BACT|nr:hypothetical protein [Flavisolibacter ginsengisoli]SHF59176.1 hypothetical protein SAMN02745131_03060 [Flavisolibacter ginsengisoli DSM 18119]
MKKIKTYEDLLQEEQRLLSQLKASELLIRDDIAGVKEGLKPIGKVMKTISKFTTRDKTGAFANFGLDFSVDLLVRRILLAKAGWLTKIVIPYVVKNYSSHFISEQQKAKLMQKISNILSKLRPKPDTAHTAESAR